MCGRFTLTLNPEAIQLAFELESIPAAYTPRYNIAPAQPVLALTNEGHRHATMLRWGLIPSWAKDPAIGDSLINARSETLAEKPCLILADGFYEWQKDGPRRITWLIRLKTGEPFGFAGLYETWVSPRQQAITSCAIITTTPNEIVAPIHRRMPVIIPKNLETAWLDPGYAKQPGLLAMLQPYPSEEMECRAWPPAGSQTDGAGSFFSPG